MANFGFAEPFSIPETCGDKDTKLFSKKKAEISEREFRTIGGGAISTETIQKSEDFLTNYATFAPQRISKRDFGSPSLGMGS